MHKQQGLSKVSIHSAGQLRCTPDSLSLESSLLVVLMVRVALAGLMRTFTCTGQQQQ